MTTTGISKRNFHTRSSWRTHVESVETRLCLPANEELERPLSPVEQVIWRLDQGASLNVTMVCRIRGPVSEVALRRALDYVQQMHPCLQVRIEESMVGPAFCSRNVPCIPLTQLDVPLDRCTPIVESEINRAIPSQIGPLARCVYLRHSQEMHHLLVTFHHVVGDGISGALLMRDILMAMADRDRQTVAATAASRRTIPLDQRLPSYTKGWRGVAHGLGFQLKSSWQDMLLRKPQRMRMDVPKPPNERTVRVYPHEFEPTMTGNLVDRARREGTSVHGALSAAMCLAVAEDIAQGKRISLKFLTPVNLRHLLLPPVNDEIGFFASIVFFRGCLSGRDHFWNLARRVRRQIQREIQLGTPCIIVRLMPCLARFLQSDKVSSETFAARWMETTPNTCSLTNIGRIDFETQIGALQIEALHFAVALSGLADFSCSASSIAGRLNCNFLCPEPVFHERHARRLIASIVERIERAVL